MNRVNIQTDAQFLRTVEIPGETRFYKPVAHGDLIDMVRDNLSKENFIISREEYKQAKAGRQATGHYYIQDSTDQDMGLQFVWQNSYDKEVSLKLAIGGNVFVCSNGMVSGDIGAFRHKHVGVIQTLTPTTVNEFVKRANDHFASLVRVKERMKEIDVTKQVCAELVGRLFIEEAILNTEQITLIRNQISKPSFNYGAPGSLWEFYNHVTYALKGEHPQFWMRDHIRTHEFLTRELELV